MLTHTHSHAQTTHAFSRRTKTLTNTHSAALRSEHIVHVIAGSRSLQPLQILADHIVQNGVVVAQIGAAQLQVDELLLVQLNDTLAVVGDGGVLEHLRRRQTAVNITQQMCRTNKHSSTRAAPTNSTRIQNRKDT